MKLGQKLPLAFALAMGLMLAGALFGILRLNGVLSTFENEVLRTVDAHKRVAVVNTDFAIAVQEWKNVLLRGKEPADLEKYWTAHQNAIKKVRDGLAGVDAVGDPCPAGRRGLDVVDSGPHLGSRAPADRAGHGSGVARLGRQGA